MSKKIYKPLPAHEYHKKSDFALRFIIKDAGEAARNMRGMDYTAECKYLDQINDAQTVLNYRSKVWLAAGGATNRDRAACAREECVEV